MSAPAAPDALLSAPRHVVATLAALDHQPDVIRMKMEPPDRTGGSFFGSNDASALDALRQLRA
jgi:hypothetical protein